MAEILYPERQRCKTCRKGFSSQVLGGMYCSYRCGKYPTPAKTLTEAPRGCKRQVDNTWGYKTRYNAPSEVPVKYRNDPSTNIYLCDNCRTYHIGHSRPDETPVSQELTRYVKDYAELASVVERYLSQKNIDKKDLAKKLKVPTIRITEFLSASNKTSPDLIFKILYELRLRVELKTVN